MAVPVLGAVPSWERPDFHPGARPPQVRRGRGMGGAPQPQGSCAGQAPPGLCWRSRGPGSRVGAATHQRRVLLVPVVEVLQLLSEGIHNLGVPRHVRGQDQGDHALGGESKALTRAPRRGLGSLLPQMTAGAGPGPGPGPGSGNSSQVSTRVAGTRHGSPHHCLPGLRQQGQEPGAGAGTRAWALCSGSPNR